jgi:hypothetical protein
MANFNLSSTYGAYTLTTNLFDPSNVYNSDLDENVKLILVRLYQDLNYLANVVNVKETAQYTNSFPIVNGQQWFPNPLLNSNSGTTPVQRNVFRTVINFGALPNATTKSVAHNITCTSGVTFTRIYATASDTTGFNYIPIPYASNAAATAQVMITVDSTNVTIDTGTVNRSNFNVCYVVLEYLLF